MSKILVGSAFFDSVSLFTSAMIKVLHNNPTDHPRRIVFNPTATQKRLSDFVSTHHAAFHSLEYTTTIAHEQSRYMEH